MLSTCDATPSRQAHCCRVSSALSGSLWPAPISMPSPSVAAVSLAVPAVGKETVLALEAPSRASQSFQSALFETEPPCRVTRRCMRRLSWRRGLRTCDVAQRGE